MGATEEFITVEVEDDTHTVLGPGPGNQKTQYNWIKWRTLDGRKLSVHEMTDSHLVNATRQYRKTKAEQVRRMKTYNSAPGNAEDRYAVVLWVLEEEVKLRGLTLVLDPPEKGPLK